MESFSNREDNEWEIILESEFDQTLICSKSGFREENFVVAHNTNITRGQDKI